MNEHIPSEYTAETPLRQLGDWQVMPAMPLRGVLVYPHMVTHLDAGRDRSIHAIDNP